MRDHLISLIGGLGSLFLIYILLGNPSEQAIPISKPHSEDRGEYGLQGLRLWLDENKLKTYSLRRRYQYLASDSKFAGGGNLLITTLPHAKEPEYEQNWQLMGWLDQGNSILVMVAENDSPQWSQEVKFLTYESELLKELGFQFKCTHSSGSQVETEQQQSENEPPPANKSIAEHIESLQQKIDAFGRTSVSLVPNGNNPVLHKVKKIQTHMTPAHAKAACDLVGLDGQFVLPILKLPDMIESVAKNKKRLKGSTPAEGSIPADGSKPAMWQVRVGGGRVWISGFSDLLSNESLGQEDNSQLLLNLLRYSLSSDGMVIFDDFHQGLSELYDPDAFFSDERLHNTLIFIAVFWLVYLLGYVNRLAKPGISSVSINTSHYIKATAGFYARRVSERGIAEGMLRHFFSELSHAHRNVYNGQPDWRLLESCAEISERDILQLKQFIHRLEAGKKPDLLKLQQMLYSLKRARKI